MRRLLSLFGGLMVILLSVSTVVRAEITIPEYESGDKWTYQVEMSQMGMGFSGEWTFKVRGEKTVSGHKVYDISVEGDGSVSIEIPGFGVATLDYTLEGFEYLRTSDLATVQDNITFHMTTSVMGIEMTIDMYLDMSYSPPMSELKFPLDLNNEWTSSSSVTSKVAQVITTNGNTTSETHSDTDTRSLDFKVDLEETTSVPAGQYQSYRINQTGDDGAYSHYYISDKVGFFTKSVSYDDDGDVESLMQLKSYSYSPGKDAGLMEYLWLVILIVIVLVVIVAAAGVRSRGAKKKMPPTGEIPPPEQG